MCEKVWCQYLIHQNKACHVPELVDVVHLHRRLLACFSSVFHGPYATEAGYVRHCVHSRDRFAYAPKSHCPEALGCHKGCLSFGAFLLCFVCVWATIKGNYPQLQTSWRLFLISTLICFTYSRIMPWEHKIIACCRSRISCVIQIFPVPLFFSSNFGKLRNCLCFVKVSDCVCVQRGWSCCWPWFSVNASVECFPKQILPDCTQIHTH